jgi:hypothetical protein
MIVARTAVEINTLAVSPDACSAVCGWNGCLCSQSLLFIHSLPTQQRRRIVERCDSQSCHSRCASVSRAAAARMPPPYRRSAGAAAELLVLAEAASIAAKRSSAAFFEAAAAAAERWATGSFAGGGLGSLTTVYLRNCHKKTVME